MLLSEAELTTITLMYVLAFLAAIVGNCCLIYIVWKKPEVRSLTSSMFVNMAIADSFVALFMMPLSIIQLYTGSGWAISGLPGDITCRSYYLISYATIMASILCLVFMAIDRFCAIVCPLTVHSVWFRKAKYVTPLIWGMSLTLMAIILFVYKLNYKESFCEFHPNVLGTQTETFRIVFIYIFVITYLIPLSIICPLYAKAACKLWFNQAPGNQLLGDQQSRQTTTRKKVIRMLIIIVVVFALCWLPAQVIHLFWAVTAYRVHLPPIAMYLGFWLAHTNSAINPWLYIALSTKIRLAFVRMATFQRGHTVPRQSRQRSTRSTEDEAVLEARV